MSTPGLNGTSGLIFLCNALLYTLFGAGFYLSVRELIFTEHDMLYITVDVYFGLSYEEWGFQSLTTDNEFDDKLLNKISGRNDDK